MSGWDPAANRQDAIETACHNAIRAIANEAEAAHRERRSPDDRLALAAALEAINRELTADQPDVSLPFTLQHCVDHLRRTAALRRGEP
jgi:hypothetical protein